MGIFDSIKDIWGDVKGLGGEIKGIGGDIKGIGGDISSGFSGIRRDISGIERGVTSKISGIEHSVTRMGSEIGKEFQGGFNTVVRGLDTEWNKVGSSITNEIEAVGSDTVNFVTDGVVGIDKGLGLATAEITEYIPKLYMAIVPRVLRGIYQAFELFVPELLSLPANIVVFIVSFIVTVLGGNYLKKAISERVERANRSLQNMDPALLDPNLDFNEAEEILGSVLKTL